MSCISQDHDLRLVALAAVICVLACVTTVRMLQRACLARNRSAVPWLAGATLTAACAIWATHFVGMLAYEPGAQLVLDMPLTLLSLAITALGAGIAFAAARLWIASRAGTVLAGAILGITIAAMHFTGMAAVTILGFYRYDVGYVAASVATGIGFAAASLLAFRAGRRVFATVLLVLAVCGLHFIAMTALQIAPVILAAPGQPWREQEPLAIAVAGVSLLLVLLSLTGSAVEQRLSTQAAVERRFRRFANCTFEGILFQADGIVTDANQAVCALLGCDVTEVIGRPVDGLFATAIEPTAFGDAAGAVRTELLGLGAQRRPVEVIAWATEDPGGIDFGIPRVATGVVPGGAGVVPGGAGVIPSGGAGVIRPRRRRRYPPGSAGMIPPGRAGVIPPGGAGVIIVRDLSARLAAERRIEFLAHHDALTGIANRTLFQDRLSQAVVLAARSGNGLALLCLDLDRFKLVNDTIGHWAGDQLLIQVAARLTEAVRAADTVARLGADEFAILQQLADHPPAAAALAERLVARLAEPFHLNGQAVVIGVSIGVAVMTGGVSTPADLLTQADLAMYRAKANGGGACCFFEHEMQTRLQARCMLERELREAVRRAELHLFYQPLFDCHSLDLTGYEALLRWDHPTRGRVPPCEFVPLAEECGLIGQVGRWVLETACTEAVTWPQPWRIAVNLSPVQFRKSDLVETVAAALECTGLDPRRLEIELTEGVLIEDADRALAVVTALRQLGVRVALDDFGTGYSSLSYLRRFPLDKIKIDRAFVQELEDHADSEAIVGAIVTMAQSLRLEVTAEGVETEGQLRILRQQGCTHLQGYLLGRPTAPADLAHRRPPAPASPGVAQPARVHSPAALG